MDYEHDRILNTYLLFHFGTREEILAGSSLEACGASLADGYFRFPVATVSRTFEFTGSPVGKRALDLGCAVGRSSFELSKHADEVIGIDYSQAFITAAERLRAGETLGYLRYSESHLEDELSCSIPGDAIPTRIGFETGDAMSLREDLGAFDYVHAANLLCRLGEPLRFLERLPDLVKPGGELVMATPCTWLEDFTPAKNQPAAQTIAFLKEALGGAFELKRVAELPFLIREHARKIQISTSQTSVWERKNDS